MQDFTNTNKAATGLMGDYTMAEGTQHRRYSCSTEGDTEIRVIPSFNAEGLPEPLIKSPEITSANISDAFIRVGMVNFYGKERYSLIEAPPPGRLRQGPLQFFYNYIVDEVKNKPRTCSPDWRRWQGLRDEGDIQAPKRILSAPSATLICQGILIQHKGQLCTDKNGNITQRYPVIVTIKPSGAKTLLDNLLSPEDNNAPWSDDNNKLGNMLDLTRGRTLKIKPYDTEHNGMKQTWYKCELGDSLPVDLALARSIWRPWNEVLNLQQSVSDVIQRIAETFDARSVVQVFESDPTYAELIPKVVYEAKMREERILMGSQPTPVPLAPHSPYPAFKPEDPVYVGGPTYRNQETAPANIFANTAKEESAGLQLPIFDEPEEETGFSETDVLTPIQEPKAASLQDRLSALRNRVSK